jgi:transcription-repair coupling factor (superfamily II helicase)
MAGELVRLYSVRMAVPGHAFGPDTPWQLELEDAFPYDETGDQLTAIEDVKQDMRTPKPMDRLICGDVGFGKTEVAVRAAFRAVMEGKQVAVLVPTTLLAEQHAITFGERFAPFPVKVAMLSRFVSPTEQKRVVADVAKGAIDVVIGTHRLLSSDVVFKDLGLVIVDEEQRFGVVHKERLKKMRAHVDVLTMTATPIPRTLEMALTGIRDMSTIDTPPEDRHPVLTYVGPYDESLALGAVRRELLREGQVFWVHNRIATIDRQAAWLQEQLPDARIVIAHGRMDEADLEKQMMRFWDREADLLVCTVIIESGLDVPNANTLVVDSAHLLGLAQMYQLRGRVGRSTERAFAYFFFAPTRELSEEAHERLATISKHQSLGSGFQIALRDLEIRGAGNLLGAEQHGHIAAVGFDTYCRILQESVAEMKGEPLPEQKELRIDLPVKAFVPPGWIAQEALRLDLYRRISTAGDHATLDAVRAEIVDRYGALPPEVDTLFAVAALRVTAAALGIDDISTFRDQVRIRPVALSEALLADLGERVPDATFHDAKQTLNLVPDRVFGIDLVRWVEARLCEAAGQTEAVG